MIDIAVVVAVALGAFAGWRRGFIIPAVALAVALLGVYQLYAGAGSSFVPSGTAGLGLGFLVLTLIGSLIGRVGSLLTGLVYRYGPLKAADHTLGVPLGAVTALVSVYLALVAVVSFDNILAPFHGKPTVDQAAVAALRTAIQANPQFATMLDPATLDAMALQVTKSAIPADQLAQFDATLGFYENTVRPALLSSMSAPILLGIGEKLPFIGHHVDFPTK